MIVLSAKASNNQNYELTDQSHKLHPQFKREITQNAPFCNKNLCIVGYGALWDLFNMSTDHPTFVLGC